MSLNLSWRLLLASGFLAITFILPQKHMATSRGATSFEDNGTPWPVGANPPWDYLGFMEVQRVWREFGATGDGIIVAVLDSGVDPTHPDLVGKMAPSPNWAEFNSQGYPVPSVMRDDSPSGHGTAVTSIIVGGDTESDFMGVAPDAKFIHAKVVDIESGNPMTTASQIAAGIEWAVSVGRADIIVMSIDIGGIGGGNTTLANKLSWAADQGAICIGAAGNSGLAGELCAATSADGNIASPAAEQFCLGVGGVQQRLASTDPTLLTWWGPQTPPYSGAGSSVGYIPGTVPVRVKPNFVAPAKDILVAQLPALGGGRKIVTGTSGSAPLAGGLAALMLSASENLRQASSKNALYAFQYAVQNSAAHAQGGAMTFPYSCGALPWPNKYYGYGFVLGHAAMTGLQWQFRNPDISVDWGDVTGTVTADGQPIDGAVIRFESQETTNRPTRQYVRSGPDGRYSITIEHGTWLNMGGYGYYSTEGRHFTVTVERPPFSFEPHSLTTYESPVGPTTLDIAAGPMIISNAEAYTDSIPGQGVNANYFWYQHHAVVKWTTNVPATTRVEYRKVGEASWQSTVEVPALKTDHYVLVPGPNVPACTNVPQLDAGSAYEFRPISRVDNWTATGGPMTATTKGAFTDITCFSFQQEVINDGTPRVLVTCGFNTGVTSSCGIQIRKHQASPLKFGSANVDGLSPDPHGTTHPHEFTSFYPWNSQTETPLAFATQYDMVITVWPGHHYPADPTSPNAQFPDGHNGYTLTKFYFTFTTPTRSGGGSHYEFTVAGENEALVTENALFSNNPNPFASSTGIRFAVKEDSKVRLEIFDLQGRNVRTLANETMSPGLHEVHWDRRSTNGERVNSGIYFYKLVIGQFIDTKKMVVLR